MDLIAWTTEASPGVTNLDLRSSYRRDNKNNRGRLRAAPVVCCFVYFFLFLARDLPSDWPFLKLACIF